jgi:hypothetical protein
MPETSPSDLGPVIQRDRGDLIVLDVADPERPNAPNIRRAMRNPQYVRLWRKGDISDEQRNVCDRYEHLTERRDGARWVNGERVGGSVNPAYRGHPTSAQVQASATLTTAHKALGNEAAALVQMLVIANLPIEEIARRIVTRPEIAKGRVLAAIIRLEEHWSR